MQRCQGVFRGFAQATCRVRGIEGCDDGGILHQDFSGGVCQSHRHLIVKDNVANIEIIAFQGFGHIHAHFRAPNVKQRTGRRDPP